MSAATFGQSRTDPPIASMFAATSAAGRNPPALSPNMATTRRTWCGCRVESRVDGFTSREADQDPGHPAHLIG